MLKSKSRVTELFKLNIENRKKKIKAETKGVTFKTLRNAINIHIYYIY